MSRKSSAALRPSLVILSMLSSRGSTRPFLMSSVRATRFSTKRFNSGLAGALRVTGLPSSSFGTGSLSISAVRTSATCRN